MKANSTVLRLPLLARALLLSLMPLFAFQAANELLDFESAETSALPAGWLEVNSDLGLGNNWGVLAHLDATSGTRILAKTGMLADPGPWPKAIWLGRSFRDGELRVQIKPMGGLGPQVAGVVFRYLDEDNYYGVAANLLTGEASIQRLEAGKVFPVAGTAHGEFQPNRTAWTLCRVVFGGPRIVVFLNGRKCAETTDSTDGWAGKVGLWAASGSFTFFDDFQVAALN